MDAKERAAEIAATISSPGWVHIQAIMDEMADEAKEQVFSLMTSKPEALTGRKALITAGALRFVRDFKESISDAVRPLAPTRIGRVE